MARESRPFGGSHRRASRASRASPRRSSARFEGDPELCLARDDHLKELHRVQPQPPSRNTVPAPCRAGTRRAPTTRATMARSSSTTASSSIRRPAPRRGVAHACRSGLPFGSRGKAGTSSSAGATTRANMGERPPKLRNRECLVALDHGAEGPRRRACRSPPPPHRRHRQCRAGWRPRGPGPRRDPGPYRVVQPSGQHQVPIRSESSEVLRRHHVHVSWRARRGAEFRSRPSAMDREPRFARSHPARRPAGMVADVDLHAVEDAARCRAGHDRPGNRRA